MDDKYLEHLALTELSSVQCYKILLLLLTKNYTQAQLAVKLNMKNQNVQRYVKELEGLRLIEVDRIEGRNKFYKPVINMEILNKK